MQSASRRGKSHTPQGNREGHHQQPQYREGHAGATWGQVKRVYVRVALLLVSMHVFELLEFPPLCLR